MSATPTVVEELHGRVLVVRIVREHKRNAIDVETARGLDGALNRLEDDPDIWAGVLTGTSTVFSAGTDLRAGADARTDRGGAYGVVGRRRLTPLVAAVEGPAVGGGMEIALACDLVVASRTAWFALPETRRGVVATSGALFRAPRALPPHVAKELLVAGSSLDAERAHQWGLVNRLTEPGEALATARELADDICRSSPVSVRATLAALHEVRAAEEDAGWAATARASDTVAASADMREGIDAFFERREPRWRGR